MLTSLQIAAILNLMVAFYAPTSTIDAVRAALTPHQVINLNVNRLTIFTSDAIEPNSLSVTLTNNHSYVNIGPVGVVGGLSSSDGGLLYLWNFPIPIGTTTQSDIDIRYRPLFGPPVEILHIPTASLPVKITR